MYKLYFERTTAEYCNGKEVLRHHSPSVSSNEAIYNEVQSLIRYTDSARWRFALRKMLEYYIQPAFLTEALDFLISIIQSAKKTRQCCKYNVPLDFNKRPRLLNLEMWRNFMCGMNFEITEPDTNHEITLIDLRLGDGVTDQSLVAMERLLLSLKALMWEDTRMILFLGDNEGVQVLQLIDCMLLGQFIPTTELNIVEELCERYPKTMERIGFRKDRHNRKIVVTGPTPPDYFIHIHLALCGLYFNGVRPRLNSVNV